MKKFFAILLTAILALTCVAAIAEEAATEPAYVTAAELPTEAEQKILGYADTLARELGLRELGRIDFFLREGEIYFNEINTMPGFTSGSLYPRMLCGCGISPTELLTRLIESARRRGV